MGTVPSAEQLHTELGEAVSGARGLAAADRLCRACVNLLDVDGAAISLVHQGASRGTFGSSSPLSQRLDAYQFTYGEGPCRDAVTQRRPILVEDLSTTTDHHWPAFTTNVLQAGVHAVFAFPIAIGGDYLGTLNLFRHTRGNLTHSAVTGALLAARVAALPVLDLIAELDNRALAGIVESDQEQPWSELESLDRVDIYQATGFLIAQLDLGPTEALVRLRARAFTTNQTATDVAYDILTRRLWIDSAGDWIQNHHHHDDPRPPHRG